MEEPSVLQSQTPTDEGRSQTLEFDQLIFFFPRPFLQNQGSEQQLESFPGQDPSMMLDQKPHYGQGYPGPPAMPMQSGYGGSSMQGQAQQGGFGPMLSQMGQGGSFPGMGGGMGAMGHPRANMMRPRMMSANKPMRLQLQQRLQGTQVRRPQSVSFNAKCPTILCFIVVCLWGNH